MEKSGVAHDFPHAELVVAGFDGSGMVSGQAESASGIGGGDGGRVTESENGVERFVAQRLHGGGGGFFWICEAGSDGVVAPGIGKFMAAIGDVSELDVEFARGDFETTSLVAELGGEERDGFCGCYRHRYEFTFRQCTEAQVSLGGWCQGR